MLLKVRTSIDFIKIIENRSAIITNQENSLEALEEKSRLNYQLADPALWKKYKTIQKSTLLQSAFLTKVFNVR